MKKLSLFKAHRLVYHSTLGFREIENKNSNNKEVDQEEEEEEVLHRTCFEACGVRLER